MKDYKDPSTSSKLDETWVQAYDEGGFHILDGILYHRAKHTCVMALKDRTMINTILHECHDSVAAGHLSEDRTLERVKTFSWWPNWKKDVAEYCQTCDRCKKENRAPGKEFGMMVQIQEQKSPWEIVHMDWVTALPPGGDRSYNACLVLVDRYSKTPMFLPCQKDDTAMDTAIMICNKAISHTGLFQKNISDRDPKFASALWTNRHNLFSAYFLEFKDSDGFTQDWCTLIPDPELAYRTAIHSSTGKTPAMVEKGWSPRLPYNTLKKDLVDIHPTASILKWDKIHKPPELKIGDLVLVSALNSKNRKGPKKLKDSFAGPFIIKALNGPNAVKLELTGELMNKHPTFPVSLIKPYRSSDKELFPLRNKHPLEIPPSKEGEEKQIVKVLKERRKNKKIEGNTL
ncbi:hypothetical protein O181_060352 [Austropuccinia psidii MF-1]|uniref:Integrase catalytic domain-containing protein n=1 Tax=Austropuccinia psidii MF-1 TaxID=1389203 RepID=A0A9Q3ENF9_9BASI|nr:hypothetical protein [Austropuccinia psidii MF-1]